MDMPHPLISMHSTRMDTCTMTHRGRRERNEDACIALELDGTFLLAVADGLGGCPAGEIASRLAVEQLSSLVKSSLSESKTDAEIASLLESIFLQIHLCIEREGTGPRKGMGTTLTAAIVRGGSAIIANTGDSRAYILNQHGMRFRTRDHSPVERLLRAGSIDEETARIHPFKNIVDHALGIDFAVDTYVEHLEPEDILLLSTDGLHDYLEPGVLLECASRGDAGAIALCLFEQACKYSMDNITLVVYCARR